MAEPTTGELFKAKTIVEGDVAKAVQALLDGDRSELQAEHDPHGDPASSAGEGMSHVESAQADVVTRMLRFAEDASQIALKLRADGLSVSYKGADLGQALTEADLAISRMLHAQFGPRLIEEETADAMGFDRARDLLAQKDWTFIGDPIDGTKPYAGGLPGWGTMIAACRHGWPIASVMALPAWFDDRTAPVVHEPATEQRGILLAGYDGGSYWSPMVDGRMQGPLRPLQPPIRRTHHIGWLPVAAQRYTLDYTKGLFPWCESAAIADAALVATGRLDATLVNHKLWDLAPILPVLQPLGFRLFHWMDMAPCPLSMINLFDHEFRAHGDLWLLCRDEEQALRLSQAILLARPMED
ncbi:inositol monophosphatase family protein [Methylobacterium iners]|uniref:3'(2'),5'-bisphosphate nucleotidase CysQ n=1 Tax=Methylobacterium iners TaxID=418707 RepID=A0ABQ4S2F6_9HYPH|nr:inositol monophosphatase family protein [Methylobacterium iners]GJD96643.1 3'(2'),5'-bisphosphate nucleotidase CysQ [Methylobacterium iners]